MSENWRISSFNGVLLAAYFIPTWTLIAINIVIAPVFGFYQRPNVAVALFLSDYLQISGMNAVRAAWLLALGRFMVVSFFVLFLVLQSIPRIRRAGGGDEALSIALGIGGVISLASLVMASAVGEIAALKLHATELLLFLGAAVVLVIERPVTQRTETRDLLAEPLILQPSILQPPVLQPSVLQPPIPQLTHLHLGRTASAREESDDSVGEGARLLDVGNVGGIENGHLRAGNPGADELGR